MKCPQQRGSLISRVAMPIRANRTKTIIKFNGSIAILASRKIKRIGPLKGSPLKKDRRVLRRDGDNQTLNQAK